MQMYKVLVRGRKIEMDGVYGVYEDVEYTNIYAVNANDAIESIIVQKKVDRSDIIGVKYEIAY